MNSNQVPLVGENITQPDIYISVIVKTLITLMQSHSAKEGHLEVKVAFLPIVLIFYLLPFREPGLFFVYTLIFKGKQKFESCLWPELRHFPAVFQCFIFMAVFLLVSYLIVNPTILSSEAIGALP